MIVTKKTVYINKLFAFLELATKNQNIRNQNILNKLLVSKWYKTLH